MLIFIKKQNNQQKQPKNRQKTTLTIQNKKITPKNQ